ncbi:MAG: ribonuclease PH [Vulcanibacillus sp.]
MRIDERLNNELRKVNIIRDYNKHAEGSVLIEVGATRVICTASIEDRVPIFKRGEGKGWITAEYSMIPRATHTRNQRESTKGKVSGRTMEISRLIGRALRSIVNFEHLGEKTIWIDCDVIQADGGTRTASITGSFVAIVDACYKLLRENKIERMPIESFIAATSVGIINDESRLDLDYLEDSQAKVDMNIVMTSEGKYVEIQGTGEESPFSEEELFQLLKLGKQGIMQLIEYQKEALGDIHKLIGQGK